MKVYVSGALTGVSNIEQLKYFYEAIAKLCAEMGIEAYVPHLNSDPQKHAGLTPVQVYEMDSHQVRIADLVIAYIGVPSLGVGAELEIAHYAGTPIVLLYEAGDKPVSRMARGNPSVHCNIIFGDIDEALYMLKHFLVQFVLTHR